jgi:putative ferrous iron transport protein C
MTPIDIKQYLMKRKLVTLQDIATHFRMTTGTATPMLDLWIRKGKLKKHDGHIGCQKGCCACDPATIVSYEWIE